MSVSVAVDKFVEITQDDPEWTQVCMDGDLVPRAVFEFSDDCPQEVREAIAVAHGNDYFKLKAYIPEAQLYMELLTGGTEK